MRKRLFVTLGLLFVLALLVYLPSVRRRAREARIERLRVFPETGNPAVFEKQLLELGCSSVVWMPFEESLSHPISALHTPRWWVQCRGPVAWEDVAHTSRTLSGGVLVQTDDVIGQLGEDGEPVEPPVPMLPVEHPHHRRSATSRARSFLRAYVGW
jgi:hypothetical protein